MQVPVRLRAFREETQGGQNVILLREIASQQQTVTSAVRDFAAEVWRGSGLQFYKDGVGLCGAMFGFGGRWGSTASSHTIEESLAALTSIFFNAARTVTQ